MSALAWAVLALAAVVVATMLVFAMVGRRRPMDADVARRPTTMLLGYWVRDWLMWTIAPLERAFVRWRVAPDVFNYAGVLLGAAAGVAYAVGALIAAGLLVLLGGLADVFDGRVARARGLASAYGEFLDSSLDRFAETFAYTGVAVLFASSRWGVLAAMIALGGSMLVSYVRARGQGLGVDFRGGVMQRAERLVLLAAASLLDGVVARLPGWKPGTLLLLALAVIGLGSLLTAAYRMTRVARELRRRRL